MTAIPGNVDSLSCSHARRCSPSRRRGAERCASGSPRIRTCSTRRSRARSSAASCSRRCATSCSTSTRSLTIVPQLATSYEWSADSKALTLKVRPGVTFHDGEKLDAAAVKFNIERHKTMAGSQPPRRARAGGERRRRRSDDRAAQPVRAVLAAARAARRPRRDDGVAEGGAGGGRQVRRQAGVLGAVPVRRARRAGPDRARALSRTTGTRARSILDRIVYLPIVDATVRLANLKSGPARLHRADGAVRRAGAARSDSRFKISKITEIGYQGITINVGKSDLAQKNPLGKDPRVREAFELALDRDGIVQVVMEGEATVGNQWVAPNNPFYAKNLPIPKRDVARAKQLLQRGRACRTRRVTLMTPTTADAQKIAQVVQAMVKEAGFDVKIQSTEFATSLDMADKGQFEAYVLAWSGRADPDGNIYSFDACKQPLNYAGYCKPEVDDLLEQVAHRSAISRERKKAYEQIAAIVLKDRPIVYLYHRHWLWAYTNKLSGPAHGARRAGARAGTASSTEQAVV